MTGMVNETVFDEAQLTGMESAVGSLRF